MRSVAPMRTAKIGYIVLSVLLILAGIVLIVHPAFSISVIGIVTGIFMIVFGIFKLVGYFSKDLFRLAFQYDLAFGILLIALGAIVLLKPESVMNFICIAMGISVLADGLFKIQIAADSRRFGIRGWWLILTAAIAAGLVGLVLVFRPSGSTQVLTVIFGISMLADGVLNLVTVLTAVKIVKHQKPDIIDGDYYERGYYADYEENE